MTVTLLEGKVALNNAQGELVLQSGEQGSVAPGQAPRKTAVLDAINIIQWSLYYPAVLDMDELGLSGDEESALADSLRAYRSSICSRLLTATPTVSSPVPMPQGCSERRCCWRLGRLDKPRTG